MQAAPILQIERIRLVHLWVVARGCPDFKLRRKANVSRMVQPEEISREKGPPRKSSSTLWTFAYGANMSLDVLSKRGVQALQSLPAKLPGYRLAFNHRGGFSNVVPLDEEQSTVPHVHGVVHEISFEDLQRLRQFETGYRVTQLQVTTYTGHHVDAQIFVSEPGVLIREGLPPTMRYLGLIQEAVNFWQLEESYRQWILTFDSIKGELRGPEYSATPNSALANKALIIVCLLAIFCYICKTSQVFL